MRFDVLTLIPDFFPAPLAQSVIGKALEKGLIDVRIHNIRDYTEDRHRTTDDYPYGGGHGMVMKVEPIVKALEAVASPGPMPKVILTSPQGVRFDQALARDLAKEDRIAVICGRYEGVDERVRGFVDMDVSAGDYVLTGGEIPALLIIDAVSRLLPGVLGAEEAAGHDSFSDGLLEYPQYTRPEEWRGLKVPDVLTSGNHAGIDRWRRQESLKRTFERRPDLLEKAHLTDSDIKFIDKLKLKS